MSLTLMRTLALGTALSLGAVACSGDSDSTTASSGEDTSAIATLSDESSDAGTDTGTSDAETSDLDTSAESTGDAEAPDDPDLAYALYDECMADFGFDFQTSVGSEGEGGIEITEEVEIDPNDPQANSGDLGDFDMDAFDDADKECAKHLANVDSSFDLSPEQQAQMEDAQIEWAACMRDLGIDVPDLSDTGSGVTVFEVGGEESDPQSGGGFGADDFDFEAFEDAAEQCDSAFDELNDVFESAEG